MKAAAVAALAVVLVAGTAGVTLVVDRRARGGDHSHASTEDPVRRAESAPHEAGETKRVTLSDEARNNAHLEIGTAGPGRVAVTTMLPGEVSLNPEALAHVSPRVSGTAREVKKRLGNLVKKGDVLAVLESRELAELTREGRAAAAKVKAAEAKFNRVDGLFKEGVVPEKDRLAAKAELDDALISRDAAGQMLAAAGTGGGASYSLKAPLGGTIIERHVSTGEVLKDDTLCFVIADLSSLWIDLTVYPRDLARVSVGQKARVRAEGIEEPAEGTISFLGATASNEARAAKARIVLEHPSEHWRPGLFVTADVAIDERDARVIVEDDAVQTLEGKPAVFVENGDGFDVREVTVGTFGISKDGTRVLEILKGITAGERYVKKNAFVLKADLGKSEAKEED